MALSDTSKILISIKKLVGKAHTSNDKSVANESLSSGLSLSSDKIFGQIVPAHTGSAKNYHILSSSAGVAVVEHLRLSASFVAGTDTNSGRHGFSLKLPDDYETHSNNPKKGSDPFLNGRAIFAATGSLQLIPPSFDSDYEAKVYHTGSGQTQIPVLDSRDWSLDYYNGIFFQQDPPGTGAQSTNPRYVDAYLYIGEYADKGIFSSGLSGSLTQLSDGSTYLVAGSNISITSASNGQVTVAASSDAFVRTKKMQKVTTTQLSDTIFTVSGSDMSVGGFDANYIDVFLNGQLLISGTASDISSGTTDYTVAGQSTLKFSFDVEIDDIIGLIVYPR